MRGCFTILFTLCLLEIFITVKNMKALLTVEYNVHGTLNSLGGGELCFLPDISLG